jgi:tetratricopeptide (TPR) repeat protein
VNPYYVAADYSGDSYNYDQPIPAPAQTDTATYAADDSATSGGDTQQTVYPDSGDTNTQQAMAIFNSGRELFKQNDYQGALDKVDQAIKMLPSDATLHEFRGACQFALKKYQEAAATLYAVLAAGPGWDWDTMQALYPNTATYTTQLRALEDYKRANPDKADASFLLAYEYLVLGYPDQAEKELEQVVKLQPTDKLSAAILKALQDRSNPQQQQQQQPAVTES